MRSHLSCAALYRIRLLFSELPDALSNARLPKKYPSLASISTARPTTCDAWREMHESLRLQGIKYSGKFGSGFVSHLQDCGWAAEGAIADERRAVSGADHTVAPLHL